jgi:predicted transcriptional regulator
VKLEIEFFMKLNDPSPVNDKQLAMSTLQALPETASLHDIREELEILDAIKSGQQAAREGRVQSQEAVEKQFASWNSK